MMGGPPAPPSANAPAGCAGLASHASICGWWRGRRGGGSEWWFAFTTDFKALYSASQCRQVAIVTKWKVLFFCFVLVAAAAGAYLLLAPKPDAHELAERAFYAIEENPFDRQTFRQATGGLAAAEAGNAGGPRGAVEGKSVGGGTGV